MGLEAGVTLRTKSMSDMGIFQHLNFAETFAVAPLGVRFKFADASGIRSNLPQLS